MVAAAMYLQVGAVNRRREQLAVLDDEDVLSRTTGARRVVSRLGAESASLEIRATLDRTCPLPSLTMPCADVGRARARRRCAALLRATTSGLELHVGTRPSPKRSPRRTRAPAPPS